MSAFKSSSVSLWDSNTDAAMLTLFLLCLALCTTSLDATPDEERLFADLLGKNNPAIRPVDNSSEAVVVTIGAALQMIVEMDERNQHITTSLWMRFSWTDYHFHWDPKDYGDTRSLVVPLDRVWRPDIVLYNNADAEFRGMIDTSPTLAHDGTVYWNRPAIFKSSCNIDVSHFPFDEQRCFLKFGSWSYDSHSIDLANRSTTGDMAAFIDNGEWDVIGMPLKINLVYYNCCPAPYPDITFTIVMRRRPYFYLFNLLIPCLLTSFVTAVNFVLPSDTGEKIGMALTVLLALMVFLLLVAETIPPSETTPLIGKYFAATIFIVSVSVVMTVFVLRLHYQLPGVQPVPLWLRQLAFVYLAPILLVKASYDHGKPVVSPVDTNNKPNSASTDRIRNNKNNNTTSKFPSGIHAKTKSMILGTPAVEERPVASELVEAVASINENLQFLVTRYSEQDADDDILTQWKYVAQVFDRLFLWVYLLLTVVATAAILGQSKPHTTPEEIYA